MGYESRLYIVRKCKIQISPESGLRWSEKIAVFNLCKVPTVSEKMRKYKSTDAFVYADDGNTEIVKDDYGDTLKEIPLADAIEIMEYAERTEDYYWRYRPCIALLKSMHEYGQGDIVVLHYGY